MAKVERICCDHCGDECYGKVRINTTEGTEWEFCDFSCAKSCLTSMGIRDSEKPRGMPGQIKGFQPRVSF